ncbi:YoaK family protein [Rhizobium oryzicola]|uniref:YoaK family protein n=1 Tax=Rhizobium oryzicola TaxID=1232668 RepID=A0ABT8T4W4_9HYPH|nr:YoaK family protein [Rhizobium oryzicola]MDO1585303.1 YoaK family protein [Rhizobium oryzicola]
MIKNAWLPFLLSFNGGYVDTASFLALQGLFAAHVTGNFVTLGAAIAMGTTGVVPKLLALPVFCLVILFSRLFALAYEKRARLALLPLLWVKLALLAAAAILTLVHGPFHDGDSLPSLSMGMLLVSAMAIQNAAHRLHLSTLPPSTIMTGTSTQIMIDIGDLMIGPPGESAVAAKGRLKRFAPVLLCFALGCAAAAVAVTFIGPWAFVIPPLVSLMTILAQNAQTPALAKAS